jgi:hypothetical protein
MRDSGDPSAGFASLRSVEVRELLRAVVALRLDQMLTETEYQAKRRQLAALR